METPVTYSLSSIDQSNTGTYLRYCLCFPCGSERSEIGQVSSKLVASVKRAISYMPMLAGSIPLAPSQPSHQSHLSDVSGDGAKPRSSAAGFTEGGQHRRVEVQVTLNQVKNFEPAIKIVDKEDFPYSYANLAKTKMPAIAFVSSILAPLPDAPDPYSSVQPVFAMQGNFIEGGVLVVMQLHHAAGGKHGLGAVIRHMSISEEVLPPRQISYQMLLGDAREQEKMRDRLCESLHAKAVYDQHPERATNHTTISFARSYGKSHIFSFSLEMLNGTSDMINERFHYTQRNASMHFSTGNSLIAILWKAITRARWPAGVLARGENSAVLIPIDIRQRIQPPLEGNFTGNSCLLSYSTMPIVHLSLPFDVSTLYRAALAIHTGITKIKEPKIRSSIAIDNKSGDVGTLNDASVDFCTDVFINSWADLPVDEEANLGIGLGTPEWARKLSEQHTEYGCVLLPVKKEGKVWEVLVHLVEEEMERLLVDPSLKPFVVGVA